MKRPWPLLRRRRAGAGWSLQFRVLALVLILAAVGLVVIDVVSLFTIRGSLMARVDQQLKAVPNVTPPPPGTALLPRDNQFLANLVIVRLDSRTGIERTRTIGPLQESAPAPDLRGISSEIAAGRAMADRVVTVQGVDSSSYSYRVRILPATAGSSEVVVIAMSLSDVYATIRRETIVDVSVSLAVLVALVGIGFPAVRVGLRPLVEVEYTAERIASGQLSSRAPHAEQATEVGRLARSFNRMLERIEDAFEQRDVSESQLRRFVADASHELRTPLTSIRAYAELFRQGALTTMPEARQAVRRIEVEAVRMGTMVDDMLLLARLDHLPELEHQPIDMGALVTDVVTGIRPTAPDHVIHLRVPIDGTGTVVGDQAGIRGVVTNLVRNSLIHTPAGTQVWVNVEETDATVHLRVADDGPGMPPEVAARVFDRFFRADPARGHEQATTGLGLSIVESMVKAHGGRVTLETSRGAGSTFVATLPAAGTEGSAGSGTQQQTVRYSTGIPEGIGRPVS